MVEISATIVSSCEWYIKKNVLWFRVSELHQRKNCAIKINPQPLTLRRTSALRVLTSRIKRWNITFVNQERVTAWRICNRDLQNFDNYRLNTWLKYFEMALVSANFFNRHTNVLVIFSLCTLIVCHATKLAGIELYLPWNSKIVYQNSRWSTIPTFSMIKVNWYDNRGKISRTW